MLKNYVKIALRNMLKHKAYTFINVMGLAVGLMCVILIVLFVQDELRYDTFHENGDRIVRVTREWLNADGSTSLHLARVAPPIGSLMKHEYPSSIEEMVRLLEEGSSLFTVGEKRIVEEDIFFAEENIFRVFTLPLVEGDPATALTQPMSVVLTESTARKFFGDEPALGKTIRYDGEYPVKITGVMKDLPRQSHIRINMLVSFVTLKNFPGADDLDRDWGSNNYATYLLLSPNSSINELETSFPDFLDNYYGRALREFGIDLQGRQPHEANVLHLQRLTDIHLHSHLTTELSQNGDIVTVWLFSAIGGFILLIACINFMNLATARSSLRAREIGMRKVLGAYRKQIMTQFLGEAILTSLIALLLGVLLASLVLSGLNEFIGKELSLGTLLEPAFFGIFAVLLGLVGFVAGSYPAFVLSSFRPLEVFGQGVKQSRRSRFRTVLVVGQFGISITLMICLGIVSRQLSYLSEKDLGFNKEQLVVVPAGPPIRENIETIRTRLLQNPNITAVSATRLVPSNMLLNSSGARVIDGERSEPVRFRIAVQEIDHDFFSTYEIPLAAGRYLSRDYVTDDTSGFVVNESAAKALGWTANEAVGKAMTYGSRMGRIVGVVHDFNFETLRNTIVPVIFIINPRGFRQVTIRLTGTDIPGSITLIERIWKEYNPDYEVGYRFLDDRFDELYRSEQRLGSLIGVASFLAVFIACLGLFGLASFMAERRTKEIGIRKVLGAGVSSLAILFSREFVMLILLANLFAWPVSYYTMSVWLQEFAYRTEQEFTIFAGAGALAIAIALLTVSFQAVRAAWTNPVESLKYE